MKEMEKFLTTKREPQGRNFGNNPTPIRVVNRAQPERNPELRDNSGENTKKEIENKKSKSDSSNSGIGSSKSVSKSISHN